MNKKIIFWAIVAATVILAAVECLTIGLPEVNYAVMSICGFLLCSGVIYMKLSLYKPKEVMWCALGGIALTMFVVFGSHFVNFLPVTIDYFNLDPLTSLVLTIIAALYWTVVYCMSLYTFVFYFCELRDKIKDFK